jgi:hypothetical protein
MRDDSLDLFAIGQIDWRLRFDLIAGLTPSLTSTSAAQSCRSS